LAGGASVSKSTSWKQTGGWHEQPAEEEAEVEDMTKCCSPIFWFICHTPTVMSITRITRITTARRKIQIIFEKINCILKRNQFLLVLCL
jgi:hypothetical protein